ncbi:MAG: hypothetical protein D6731_08700 [Planctomycetota bacterium]|nr:MAG: hypothetical protein D6731_08700 [Planctomycetota bacterium]
MTLRNAFPPLLLLVSLSPLPVRAQDREVLLQARVKHLEQRISQLEARLARLEALLSKGEGTQTTDQRPRGPQQRDGTRTQEHPLRLRPIARARHGTKVTVLAWEPGGRRLASASVDNALVVWEARSGRQVGLLRLDSPPDTVDWDPKGKRLVASTWEHEFYLWDVGRTQPLAHRSFLEEPNWETIGKIWFGPDSKSLVYVGDDDLLMGARVPSLADARIGGIGPDGLRFPEHDVLGLAWSPGRERVAIHLGGSVSVWDGLLKGEEFRADAGPGGVAALSWSADGERLACADKKGHLSVWNAVERRLLGEFEVGAVRTLAYSPDGAWLAVGGGSELRILDAISPDTPRARYDYRNEVVALAWSPDAKAIAVGGKGGRIVVLEVGQ